MVSKTVDATPPLRVHKNGLSQSKDRPWSGVSQRKLAGEAYHAIGGVARNSIANRAIVGHKVSYPFTIHAFPFLSVHISLARLVFNVFFSLLFLFVLFLS